MKKLLITGGLGHIGSRLIRELLQKDYYVVCIDNFLTERIVSLRGVITHNNFKFHEADVSKDRETIAKLFKKNNFYSAIHLSAITNAEKSHDLAKEVINNNLDGTTTLIELCNDHKTRIIFPSSTSIYGTSEEVVHEDEERFINPQSPYAECKVMEENLIKGCSSLNSVVLRLGTIFGTSPGMRFHTAVNKFCWQAVANKPITIWETAFHQYRPYLDLADACNSFRFFLDNEVPSGSTYNINTTNFTVAQIIDNIKKYVPELDLEFVDSKIMNQLSYRVLNKKVKSLGFSFKGNLDHAIKSTIDWLKEE